MVSVHANDITHCLNNGQYTVAAWYNGLRNGNTISDISGNGNDGVIIDSTGLTQISASSSDINGQPYFWAQTTTKIEFPVTIHQTEHTIIYLAKYRPGADKLRILQMTQENAFIGFWGGKNGVAYENGWITDQNNKFEQNGQPNNWMISSFQPSLYRGNFIDFTIASSPGLTLSTNTLGINTGWNTEYSGFFFAELIVFNQLLDVDSIKCIELYINSKYGLGYSPGVHTVHSTLYTDCEYPLYHPFFHALTQSQQRRHQQHLPQVIQPRLQFLRNHLFQHQSHHNHPMHRQYHRLPQIRPLTQWIQHQSLHQLQQCPP